VFIAAMCSSSVLPTTVDQSKRPERLAATQLGGEVGRTELHGNRCPGSIDRTPVLQKLRTQVRNCPEALIVEDLGHFLPEHGDGYKVAKQRSRASTADHAGRHMPSHDRRGIYHGCSSAKPPEFL
jgi:hypothetical protein